MEIFRNMPKPLAQWFLILLLIIIVLASVWTLVLIVTGPEGGPLFSPMRWSGTVAGLAVCAAFFQLQTTKWIQEVMDEFGNDEKYPYGPPSNVTRMLISDPDRPVQTAIRHYIFFHTGLAAWLGLVAGVFAIISYWVH